MFRVVVAGHGGYTNVADRLWLTSASSTEEEVGDLFGTRCPLSAAPAPAEHDIPVSSRALRQCTPSRLSGVSPSVMSQWLADGGWPGDWAVGGLVDGHGIVLGQVVPARFQECDGLLGVRFAGPPGHFVPWPVLPGDLPGAVGVAAVAAQQDAVAAQEQFAADEAAAQVVGHVVPEGPPARDCGSAEGIAGR